MLNKNMFIHSSTNRARLFEYARPLKPVEEPEILHYAAEFIVGSLSQPRRAPRNDTNLIV